MYLRGIGAAFNFGTFRQSFLRKMYFTLTFYTTFTFFLHFFCNSFSLVVWYICKKFVCEPYFLRIDQNIVSGNGRPRFAMRRAV